MPAMKNADTANDADDDGAACNAAQFRQDLDKKCFECFPASMSEAQKGFLAIVYFTRDVPLNRKDFGDLQSMVVQMVFVSGCKAGWTRVPFMPAAKGKTGYEVSKTALPLSEIRPYSENGHRNLSKMECWPYGIVTGAPQHKNARNDEWKWEVRVCVHVHVSVRVRYKHAHGIRLDCRWSPGW